MREAHDPAHSERRGITRVKVRNVRCSHGRVVDLSTRGMRLIVPAEERPIEGQTQQFVFRDSATQEEDDRIRVSGTVCWVRESIENIGLSEVGVVFDAVEPKVRDAIVRLALSAVSEDMEELSSLVRIEHENLYEALGVGPDACDDTIRRAYHKVIKRWNPDSSDDPRAQAILSAAHRAYGVLRNEHSRSIYDARFAPSRDAA